MIVWFGFYDRLTCKRVYDPRHCDLFCRQKLRHRLMHVIVVRITVKDFSDLYWWEKVTTKVQNICRV